MTIHNSRFDLFPLTTQDLWFVTSCFWEGNSGTLDEIDNFILRDQKGGLHVLLNTEDECTTILSNLGKCPHSDIAEHPRILTPWTRVLLEKLTGSAASQEIPRIFGTRRFLTVLTSARHLSLS
jgi:hypothetical protein